ncbi:ROK family protein [Chamaesiphon sp. VAR_48_metabat_135_sub]|uniref:ROK family protein n=1 Tax=Chamaesiphon sp. VAR_48_metabat_135_sub TaxID=2964699 RepID=UPI00286B159C|nr:ROK family protein [Chamaesiphon sp. VAR_48_metabat_135_sub]
MTEVIGIDLGGTAIKLGRFTEYGTCLQSLTVPTPQPAYPDDTIDMMVYAMEKLAPGMANTNAIGVGTPGPADAAGRVAKIAINLEGWIDIPVATLIQDRTGVPAVVGNDGNCAGLGENWLGAGRHYRNSVLLTLGTGVGGAVFLNGALFTGHTGSAGELGLIAFDPDGHPCKSGNNGSLEQFLSGQAIRRMTGKEPEEMGRLAAAGDRSALEFWDNYGRNLGIGLTSIIYILTPEVAIIGGGISASAKYFLPAAKREIDKRVMETSRPGFKLIEAELGNQAGITGAAKLAWEMLHRKNLKTH